MEWTSDKPTAPGIYQYRETPDGEVHELRLILPRYGGLCARPKYYNEATAEAVTRPVSEMSGQWLK